MKEDSLLLLTTKPCSLDHRNYLCYMARLKKEHGSVMEYVRDRRLGWTDLEAKGEAFQDAGMFFGSFLSCMTFGLYNRVSIS